MFVTVGLRAREQSERSAVPATAITSALAHGAPRCGRCGKQLVGRQRQWCSGKCGTEFRRGVKRAELIREAQTTRPRCLICQKPIRYGATGVNLTKATTCSKACHIKRNNWFLRKQPHKATCRYCKTQFSSKGSLRRHQRTFPGAHLRSRYWRTAARRAA